MNQDQYHLCKIAEEASEVAKRALKAQQFGLGEVQPGQDFDNLERLVDEFHDLFITFENFSHQIGGTSSFDVIPTETKTRLRLTRMGKFLGLSKDLEQVDQDIHI
jgi:hypothetical protein